MGSVTIIFLFPLFLIYFAVSSVIGAVTGVDKTEIVLPYEPEKGIVWECEIQEDSPIELVETEIDGEKQIFHFKSNDTKDMIGYFADLAKGLITKEYSDREYSYGEYYKVIFTDKNGNEKIYYAESEFDDDTKLLYDKAVFYAPDEYFAFDYTVTAQQPIEGEYGWYNQDFGYRTEFYKAEYLPTRTVTIVHAGDDFDCNEEYYNYWIEYGHIDGYKRETETVKMKYRIVDGEVEILEEIQKTKENNAQSDTDVTTVQTETSDS